jgi:methylmalonyl-CoA/ethylmalonyl-CoA epimerase
MLLTEIDHIAIAVHDLEAAIAYYAEAFGAEVHHREIVDSDGVEGATPIDKAPRPGSRGTTVAFVHPKGSFGTLIELVQE